MNAAKISSDRLHGLARSHLPFKLNPQFFTQDSSHPFVICKIFGILALQFP